MEDWSLGFLKRIVGGEIFDTLGQDANTVGGQLNAVADAGSILPTLFNIVNGFALIATALIILYVISVGVLHTAHEGQTLGKNYSTLWTPLRSAFGVMLVAPNPVFAGFNTMQAIILAMVLISVSGAKLVWDATVDYFIEHQTVLSTPGYYSPSVEQLTTLIQNEACLAHQQEAWLETRNGRAYQEAVNSNAVANADMMNGYGMASFHINLDRFDNTLVERRVEHHKETITWKQQCGSVQYHCSRVPSNSFLGKLCRDTFNETAAIAAFTGNNVIPPLINSFRNNAVINDFPDYVSGVTSPTSAPNLPIMGDYDSVEARPPGHSLQLLMSQFMDGYASRYRDTKATHVETGFIDAELANWGAAAKNRGWIYAGTWHWYIHNKSFKNAVGDIAPTYRSMSEKQAYRDDEFNALMTFIRDYMNQSEFTVYDSQGNPTLLRYSAPNHEDDIMTRIDKVVGKDLAGIAFFDLEDGRDPIGRLVGWGHNMINGSAAIIAGAAAANVAASAVGESAVKLVGGGGMTALGSMLFSLVIFLVGPLMLAGGFLAFYLPAIPFIFWMFGILGWLIMICESLIAAPLWAAAHAIPEGEGAAGRHAVQGYQLFANVIFRPILLLLGLILSMQVLQIISYLAISGYMIVGTGITNVYSWGISSYIGIIFFILILVSMIITLAHKSYEMIYETADNVMRWIGFGVRPLGEAQGEASTSRTYGAAAVYSRDLSNSAIAKGGKDQSNGKNMPNKTPTNQNDVAGGTEAKGNPSGTASKEGPTSNKT